MNIFHKSFLIVLFAFSFTGCETKFESAKDVLTTLQDKWRDSWYKAVQYDQKLTFYNSDTIIKTSHWKQFILSPNFMQIRYDNFESGNGSLYRNDSVYDFQHGELANARSFVNYVLLLTTEIYFIDVKESLYKLKDFGIDLTKICETTWNEEEVVIIGTDKITDTNSSQVWFNKENLYVVRTILNVGNRIQDTEFSEYEQIENHWIPKKLTFKSNGVKIIEMENSNVKFPDNIDQSYFEISNFTTKAW